MKSQIRIIGVDDAPFDRFVESDVLVVGTFFRGGSSLDGVLSTRVVLDGGDSTLNIASMINDSKFRSQVQFILLDGIAVAGFNIIDIRKLYELTDIPVIVVSRTKPDFVKIKGALLKLGQLEKYSLIEAAGTPVKVGDVYVQFVGTDLRAVEKVIKLTCVNSNLPEPIRVAHLIGSGIVFGESSGNP